MVYCDALNKRATKRFLQDHFDFNFWREIFIFGIVNIASLSICGGYNSPGIRFFIEICRYLCD